MADKIISENNESRNIACIIEKAFASSLEACEEQERREGNNRLVFDRIGTGSYGIVYRLVFEGKFYAVKIGLGRNSVRINEYEKLRIMRESGATPNPLAFYDNFASIDSNAILMEYVEGHDAAGLICRFLNGYERTEKYIAEKLVQSLSEAERKFEERKLTFPADSHVLSNYIITPDSRIVVVDLERCFRYSLFKDEETAVRKSRMFGETARDTLACLIHMVGNSKKPDGVFKVFKDKNKDKKR